MSYIIPNKQYVFGGHTVTFSRHPKQGDVLHASLFVEVDGEPPREGDPIPDWLDRIAKTPDYIRRPAFEAQN